MATNESYIKFKDIVFSFCKRITNVLNSGSSSIMLDASDNALVKAIVEYHKKYDKNCEMNEQRLTEKDRTEMDILLFDECNKYVNAQMDKPQGFEIGAGIESVELYYRLLNLKIIEKTNQKLPILENIKKLVVLRLTTMDLTGNYYLTKQYVSRTSDRVSNLNKQVQRVQSDIVAVLDEVDRSQRMAETAYDNANKVIKIVDNSRSEIYKDIITIITLFSAIILTLAGVFSFSSVAFENMTASNFYRYAFVICVLGCFIIALFGGLFYFIYNVRHDINSLSDEKIVKKLKKNRRTALAPMIVAIIVFGSLIVFLLLFKLEELEKNTSTTTTVAQEQTTPTTSVETDPNVETNAPSLEFIIPAVLPEVKESGDQ